ncbi:SdiA-regulated domain-containing protein [Roseivirga sp. E12]|uniref:SdiA-regulated domain-containing protein n=1 Tax=Roseivirga sp. E12 TaxID=2819237 RepID=UPI001ABCB4F2|nr:SdiA-regulated domain-containing protein [Roseivirga sp. E12]MBO3699973.1 SdiA-regulated domain-containing protein [Roseivirga sp. E12]
MRETLRIIFILLTAGIYSECFGQADSVFAYDLKNPDEIFVLPEYLEEVSALSYYDDNQLAMLNDEQGRMYVYDLRSRKIVHRVRFHGDGDFEGIERVGDYIYAIKSNGKLYRFNVQMEGVVEEIKTPFDSGNDVEGLGHDPHTEHLLIALKADGDIKNVDVKGKAIYGFHLPTGSFKKTPLHVIQDKELKRVVGSKFKFKPSAVAVHPTSGEVYVLSFVQRSLLVFGTDGKPKHLTKLKSSLFPQPEGIAFMPNGDLYISNEVEGEGGTILRFTAN